MSTARAEYGNAARCREDRAITRAMKIIETRLRSPGAALCSRRAVRDFLALRLADREHEVFMALWLDAQNCLIEVEEMFRGTITQAAVYPREVVKSALRHNAAKVIFAHNHPSGTAEPSLADRLLTRQLEEALSLVEVRMLDHFIVAGAAAVSIAELDALRPADPPRVPRKPRQPKAKA